MEIRMESKKGTVVSGIDPVLAEIQKRPQAHPQEWLKALKQNPGGFAGNDRSSNVPVSRVRPTPLSGYAVTLYKDHDGTQAATRAGDSADVLSLRCASEASITEESWPADLAGNTASFAKAAAAVALVFTLREWSDAGPAETESSKRQRFLLQTN